ncbi:hypothetical protein KBB96_09495 [Luteolibacter ambystomatis]|uniref:Trimeric autotransporter adhesin YadA-like head domain-containing protein n=1 Tax=Luteolibacter ambystomatis TaxID=2824561 RepID=A0A975J303_9BACT|nr:hypothetical protein [Luteolibacter ambystomatis]QUE53113.1 hypothetical protein KBB96_09495 [Luteolibacter ambystomatis]
MKTRLFSFLPLVFTAALSTLATGTNINVTDGLNTGANNVVDTTEKSIAIGNYNTASGSSIAGGIKWMSDTTTTPNCVASGNSIAMGIYNTASGSSIAIGAPDSGDAAMNPNNVASVSSIAVGTHVSATNYSAAIGEYQANLGWASGTFGSNQTIDPDSYAAFALGYENHILSSLGLVTGQNNTMEYESGSFIAGQNNAIYTESGHTYSGSGNLLLGQSNTLTKTANGPNGTILIGTYNETSDSGAIAIGRGNLAQAETITLGHFNATVSGATLIVGNGTSTSSGDRSNALVVLNNGNVVISGSLTVGGYSAVTTNYLSTNKYLKQAWGSGATTNGTGLLAIGDWASSEGSSSIAIGHGTGATSGGIAIGDAAGASAVGSMAIQASNAFGDYSFAAGGSNSTGDYSSALSGGYAPGTAAFAVAGGQAYGEASTALSAGTANGDGAIAIGGVDVLSYIANTAEGDGSVAIGGYQNIANGKYSFASGYKLTTEALAQTALGSRNLSAGGLLTAANHTSWVNTEALFELGNGNPGASPAEYSNAITTLKNGRTTLTNKFWSSSAPLDTPSDATASSHGDALVVEGHTRLKGRVLLDEAQGDISMGIYE